MPKAKQHGASSRVGTFETRGGKSYLENLQALEPTELTRKAIKAVEKSDAERAKKA